MSLHTHFCEWTTGRDSTMSRSMWCNPVLSDMYRNTKIKIMQQLSIMKCHDRCERPTVAPTVARPTVLSRTKQLIHARDWLGILVPKLTHGTRIASGNRGKSAIRPTRRHELPTPQFYNLPPRQIQINLNHILKHIRAGGITPPPPLSWKVLGCLWLKLGLHTLILQGKH